MSVISTDVDALVSLQALESYPDIGLDVLHQVAKMDGTIGIWEGAGGQDSAFCHFWFWVVLVRMFEQIVESNSLQYYVNKKFLRY